MKHKLLAITMLIAGAAQVACNNNSPSAAECNANPNCRAGVLASAGYGGYGQPTLIPLGPPPMAAASQVPPGGAPLANQPFRVSSIANAAIKAQSLKVAAAIAADDNNPQSPHWKIPTPDVSQSASAQASSRTPASTSTAAIQPSSANSGGSSDIGEAAQ